MFFNSVFPILCGTNCLGKIFFSTGNIAAAAANEIHVSGQAEFDALGNIKVINHLIFVCRRGNPTLRYTVQCPLG